LFFRNLLKSKIIFLIPAVLAVTLLASTCIFFISPGYISGQDESPDRSTDGNQGQSQNENQDQDNEQFQEVELQNAGSSIVYSSSGDIFIKEIDTAGFPQISVYINFRENSRLGTLALEEKDLTIVENNLEVKDFSLEKIGEINEPVSTVLVIDTSGSMKGRPISDAKSATSTFINQMRQADRISIIGFSDSSKIYSSFSSEKQVLLNSADQIEAGGETALFDGILKGIEQFGSSGDERHKYLIVLSDGTDTVSLADADAVIEKATSGNVTVYSVALVSADYNPSELQKIAESTGGELLTTTDSNELKNLYSKISEKIRNQYRLKYQSVTNEAKEYSTVISINKTGISDEIKISYSNPFSALSVNQDISNKQSLKVITKVMFIDIWWVKLIIYVLIFVSVTIFIYIISTIMVPNRQNLKSRTDYYLYNISEAGKDIVSSEKRSRFNFFSLFKNPVSRKNGKKGFSDLFDEKLKRAGINIPGNKFMLIHVVIVALVTLIVFLITKNFIVTFLVVILAIFMPFLFINFRTAQKIKKFNEQLPDTLQLIEGALKAGYSFNQSLYMVVKETKPPISEEFTMVLNEVRMGSSEKDALENMAKRINSELFNWVVLAINIQREVGGNLAEIMDIIANTIREKERVLRQIKALTAEGKLSAYVLIGLPIILGIVLSIMNREYISVLFTTKIGFMMLLLAAGLMIAGIMWIIRIVKIEY